MLLGCGWACSVYFYCKEMVWPEKAGIETHTHPFQHAQRPFCLALASTGGLAVKPTPFTPQAGFTSWAARCLELAQAFLSLLHSNYLFVRERLPSPNLPWLATTCYLCRLLGALHNPTTLVCSEWRKMGSGVPLGSIKSHNRNTIIVS